MVMVLKVDKIIYLKDARELGGCVAGWQFFIEANGFNWKDVVMNGILASQLLATDDAMAERLVQFVSNREEL